MQGERKEPQSYGSGSDWVSGETAQNVNDPKASPDPVHTDFYQSRHDSDVSRNSEGGETSTAGNDESVAHFEALPANRSEEPPRITASDTGARRDSFFKKRDY